MNVNLPISSKNTLFLVAALLVTLVAAYQARNYINVFRSPSIIQDELSQLEKLKTIQHEFDHGNQAFLKGNLDEAATAYQKVLELDHTHEHALNNLGITYFKLGNHEKALTYLEQAVAVNPKSEQVHLLIAQLFANQGTKEAFEKSAQYFKNVLHLNAQNIDALYGLAKIVLMQGDTDSAIEINKKLLDLTPHKSEVYIAIGQALEHQNNNDESIYYYKKAIEADPSNRMAHIYLAGRYLAAGNYKDGYEEYEWRVNNHSLKWDGSDPRGKTIVVISENGLGDIIQYLRFAKVLKDRGAKVILITPDVLVKLFCLCDYIDQVIPSGSPVPHYDAAISIQSIPRLIGTTVNNLPETPYLKADSELVNYWGNKLAHDKNFKIGLCWTAGGEGGRLPQGLRCIPLDHFASMAKTKGVSLYSLQKGPAEQQLKNVSSDFIIKDFGPDYDESHGTFMDTVAIMKHLDLVITVDTSVAHLAGALAVPTWLILPYTPDPRWMLDRPDTPWYPNMQLFRNKEINKWEAIVQEVTSALTKKIMGRTSN